MLLNTLDSKSRVLGADADDEVIKGNFCFTYVAFDIFTAIYPPSQRKLNWTGTGDFEDFAFGIDFRAVCFEELDDCFLVPENMADRLHNRTCFNQPRRCGG